MMLWHGSPVAWVTRWPQLVRVDARVTVYGDGLARVKDPVTGAVYFDAAQKWVLGWQLVRLVLVFGAEDRAQAVALVRARYPEPAGLCRVLGGRVDLEAAALLAPGVRDGRRAEVEYRWA